MANLPKNVISKPAGMNVDFVITVMDINNVVEKSKFVLKTKGEKIPNLSTELQQGMTIKAYAGGRTAEVER